MKSAILYGCGSIGKRHLAELDKFCEKLTVVEKSTEVRQRIKIQYGEKIQTFESVEEVTESNFDVAVISTWGPDHLEHLEELSTFKPKFLFFEKPLESSLVKVDLIERKIRSMGIPAAINFHLRFSPLYQKLISLLKSQVYGDITNISISGGAKCMSTNGIHWLDFVSNLIAEQPKSVFADLDFKQINPRAKDLAFIGGVSVWRYSQDRTLAIDFSNRSYSDLTMTVYFERAVFIFRGGEITLRASEDEEGLIKLPINRTQNFSKVEFEYNLADIEEPDGVSQIYMAIDKNPEMFKFENYIESTRQIIRACISSTEGRKIVSEEVLSNKLQDNDWRIS
jgi:predicted dehydrogenase